MHRCKCRAFLALTALQVFSQVPQIPPMPARFPCDPTGRARTALSQLSFSQCFYREHLQALPFVQHILKEKEQKKEKPAKVQYVFLLLSSLTNSSPLSLPHFMRLCSCTGPFLVCPDLNGTNLPDSLVNHISRTIPDRHQPKTRGDCQSPKDGSSYFGSTLAGFVFVGMPTLPFAFAMAPACWWTAVLLFIP